MADERIQVGIRDDAAMTLDDALSAVEDTWGDEVPAPPHVEPETVQSIVSLTSDANRNAGRVMGYGAALAWGISIGVHAERNRLARLGR